MNAYERQQLRLLISEARRSKLQLAADLGRVECCLNCGGDLPDSRFRDRRRYCSDNCRKLVGAQSGWRERRPELQPLGETLLAARKAAGYSQRQIAAKLHVNRESWRSWEQGRTTPRIDRYADIERLIGVPAELIVQYKRGPLGIGGVEADGTASAARATPVQHVNQRRPLHVATSADASDSKEDTRAA